MVNQLTYSSFISMPTPSPPAPTPSNLPPLSTVTQPSTPTKENQSSLASSASSFLPFGSSNTPSTTGGVVPPLSKKQSIVSFFGGFTGLAQKVSGGGSSNTNSPAVVQQSSTAGNTPASVGTPTPGAQSTPLSASTPMSTSNTNSASGPLSPSILTTPPLFNALKQTQSNAFSSAPSSSSQQPTTTISTPLIPTVSSQLSLQQSMQMNQATTTSTSSSMQIFDQSIMTMSSGSQGGITPPSTNQSTNHLSSNFTSSTIQLSSANIGNNNNNNTISISGNRCLPTYYDVLMDAPIYRNGELDKLDQSEKKKPDAVLVDRLISKNILIGRSVRAVSLLLDITPDHPEFMARAMKAGVVAASISQDFYQNTMKLVADNLIVANKLDDGVQILCLIDKTLEACKYLQAANRWEEAAKLAKTSLGESECMVVLRAWAVHLVQRSQQYQQIQQNHFNANHRNHHHHAYEQELNYYQNHYVDDAIAILLSIGDYYAVLQLLYEQQQYGLASHLIDICLENNIFQQDHQQQVNNSDNNNNNNNQRNISLSSLSSLSDSTSSLYLPITNSHSVTNDLPLKQLMVIIYKEYGNFLHQIHNSVAAELYWEKTGRKMKH
ncbi:hypothetical protein DFA_03270 [Cavenderia fasciculata]|uniref:WDR11 TPR domain-containing protein n=1 Tax=Cavenderia fasciculata TaxID=261658 RepID=F4PH40_CACFS|nr:uncharacterized protein DFA_03270 [Cavenderia fasciculata]EGG25024.1 hypothetical protein DFA_03270 [Cavenderia fasciculata]|eukprot:XP_004362875.1 hypothetical protein DFA_03270 [Cavenderia fasciculata]